MTQEVRGSRERLVLLNIAGEDRVGLMAEVSSALAAAQSQVLDIGQAIVHDQLVLSLLVRIPTDARTRAASDSAAASFSDVIGQVESLAASRGVALSLRDVEESDYQRWVDAQGQPRYILTLLTPGLTAAQLAAVSTVTSRHGLNIYNVERLSNRVPLEAVREDEGGIPGSRMNRGRRASVAMTLRGRISDEIQLKTELLAAGGTLNFDCSVQLDSVYRRNRRLVAFDMDSTLIQVEVIDELARQHGVYDEVAAITERAMAGELDFQQSFRQRVALLKGLSRTALQEVADNVPLTDGAATLIRSLKHFGYKIAVLSGGFQFVGERLAARLGIDYVRANTLVFENDVATGEVDGAIVDAQAKAKYLLELCEREAISPEQAIAVGDGANDLPMLAAAGLGIAFHAKPLVRETAEHAISQFGLDSVLYLLGFSDSEIAAVGSAD